MGNSLLLILAAIGLVLALVGLQVAAYYWMESKDDRIR